MAGARPRVMPMPSPLFYRLLMDMTDRITISIILGALVLLVFIIELVRQRRLEEQHSLLWLVMATALVVLAFTRDLWDWMAVQFGIAYPPTAILVSGFVALIMILLYFSTIVSKLVRQNRKAAQEIGILRWKLAELEKRINGSSVGD
jgi:hypothetical protein